MDLHTLYMMLPIWAQELGLSWYARRLDRRYYGPGYREWVQAYTQREAMSRVQLERDQYETLQALLDIAFSRVPWFRILAQRHGFRAEEFTDLKTLQRLPIMEKDPIRRDPWPFVREDYPRTHLWEEKTSGTTGTSLHIYWSREMLVRTWALHEVRVRHWAGVGQETPRAMVGGRPVIPGETTRPPFWRYNRHWRQVYMSSYHISPVTASNYVEALQRYGSQWITGYGSAIALLGEYLIEHPAALQIRAAVTSGDTVTPRHRAAIEEGFGCRLFDNYGLSEGCCIISECAHGRMHLQPESCILEIVDESGLPCPPGVDGEFVCTGLLNDAMPLIRYRTGDYGSWAEEEECPCGRKSPLVSRITGRTDDYLELADGRRVGRLSTAMKKAPSVKQAQIVQDAPDHAWLLVAPDDTYAERDGQALVEDVYSRIGGRIIRLELCEVEEIPPTRVGKHVLVRRVMHDPQAQAQYRALIARGCTRGVAA